MDTWRRALEGKNARDMILRKSKGSGKRGTGPPRSPPKSPPKSPPPVPAKIPVETDLSLIPTDELWRDVFARSPPADRRHNQDAVAADADGDTVVGTTTYQTRVYNDPSLSVPDDLSVVAQSSEMGTADELLRLCQELDSTRAKLRAEAQRADEIEERRRSYKQRMEARFDDVERSNERLINELERTRLQTRQFEARAAAELEKARMEVRQARTELDDARRQATELKTELEDARSHIFSLQPYRKDLTPEEVGRDFDDLVNSVSEWAEKFMGPVLNDETLFSEIVATARKKPTEMAKLKKVMHQYGDIVHGSLFPETDVDLVIAIIMRFLYENIFQKTLYGGAPSLMESLSFVEGSMQSSVQPKRDLFAIRNWRAEAYNAILCTPQFKVERDKHMRRLTKDLAELFRAFVREQDWNWLCVNFQTNCIEPAMVLHEKLLTSTHHFYLDLNPYMVLTARHDVETSAEFFENLKNLACENILQNRKNFNVAKLDPLPTKEELHRNLVNIVTLVPGLYMRQIGRGDAIREPTLVHKQQMLVAWGPPEKREKFTSGSERTLLNQIFFAKGEKPEKALDVWPISWKWG